MTTQLPIQWPHVDSYVRQVVERLAGPPVSTIPPPPASETRIRLSMVRGAGDRKENCRSYPRCVGEAARADGEWHCPNLCGGHDEVTRYEMLAEAIAGRCSSPLADAQEEEPTPTRSIGPRAMPLAEAVVAALAAGSMTTVEIAKATGYAHSSLSSRMVDLERAGLIRRLGLERVQNPKSTARVVRWERVEK